MSGQVKMSGKDGGPPLGPASGLGQAPTTETDSDRVQGLRRRLPTYSGSVGVTPLRVDLIVKDPVLVRIVLRGQRRRQALSSQALIHREQRISSRDRPTLGRGPVRRARFLSPPQPHLNERSARPGRRRLTRVNPSHPRGEIRRSLLTSRRDPMGHLLCDASAYRTRVMPSAPRPGDTSAGRVASES